MADSNTVSGAPLTNAQTTTQPFSLSDPSTYATIVPSFTGGLQEIGADVYGEIANVSKTIYSDAVTVIDPLIKDANDLGTGAASAIANGANYVTTKVGNAINGVTTGVGNVFSFLTSPLEWLVALAAIGIFLVFVLPKLTPALRAVTGVK